MPLEFAAGQPRGHDAGDEDPGEPTRRLEIRAERQAWKADTFWLRMYGLGRFCYEPQTTRKR